MTATISQEPTVRLTLTCYCPACRQAVDAEVRVFRHEVLCLSQAVSLDWRDAQSPIYLHNVCGNVLWPVDASIA